MRSQHFGIEMEMTGITRKTAAGVIAAFFNTHSVYEGGSYDSYSISDGHRRTWKVVSDSSISPRKKNGTIGASTYKVEVVSPICSYEDIDTIQEIVRRLRHAGACVNNSCGIHIHIDASPHSVKSLRNLVNIMAAKEELLYKALNVKVEREDRYCKKTDLTFLKELNRKKPKTLEDFERLWYRGQSRRYMHYDDSRYHALNLHSVFYKGTIEFRLFNGSLHAGKVKSYIQLCLAISHQALIQKGASHSSTQSSNEKYTFRTWLLRMGMIGDEFKTARKFLLENLDGNIAWKDPLQAERQRERLMRERQQDIAPDMPEILTDENEEERVREESGFNMQMF